MKLGSLFDGSGGFPLAGSLCGVEPVWAAEVEPYPIAVTRSRFPNMRHLGDISKVNGAEIEPVDIITFGSPCQDLSVAGKRAGIKHKEAGDDETTRSGLFMEAIRIIKEMREATHGKYPSFALWENVPGAFSSNKGEDFRVVLEELIKIVEPSCTVPAPDKNGWPYADCYVGTGWSLAYRVFDAQFWGVPQRRRRIHLVLDLRGERAEKVLFECEGLRGYFAESGAPWEGVAGDAENSIGAADREGERNCLTPWDVQSRRIFSVDGAWPALYGGEGGGRGYVLYTDTHILDDQGGSCINVRTDGKVPTLRAETHGNLPCVLERGTFQNTGPGWWNETPIGATVRTPCGGDSTLANITAEGCGGQYIVRRLTPTECARLQGFADRWGDIDKKDSFTREEFLFWVDVRNTHAAINGKKVQEYTEKQMLTWYNKLHTDSAEYKMWGNGIALPPALYCMQGIVDALNREDEEEDDSWML